MSPKSSRSRPKAYRYGAEYFGIFHATSRERALAFPTSTMSWGYFDRYDELYWNATGNYWAFPILVASVTVTLPPGGRVSATKGYTGALGEAGADYTYTPNEGRPTVKATRRLEAGEGLTVAVAFDKGLIDPPSDADRGWIWWQRHGALAILLASLGMLSWFYLRSFGRVGRDPPKGPVFARYEPPKGLSPAAVHHVYYRGVRGHLALIASLMNSRNPGHRVVRSLRTPRGFPGAVGKAKDEWDAAIVREQGGDADIVLLAEVKAAPAAATPDFTRLARGLD
ncbi:MAG: DUF2207 domain-containing protein, partial [Burkholderiales bacterium]